jgi:putative transcriptional regulator
VNTQRVKELREAAGLTQAQLAKRAGVDEKTVRKVESGKHLPSLSTAMKIAAALGVPITALLEPAST